MCAPPRIWSHLSVRAAGVEVETARGSSKQEIRREEGEELEGEEVQEEEAAPKIGEVRLDPAASEHDGK